MTISYIDAVLSAADAQIDKIIMCGNEQAMCAGGKNGPYLDLESPLRNSSHWLVTFSVAYALSQKTIYKENAKLQANFLMHTDEYSLDGVFIHRQRSDKDWCNGVIGQAWIAEGLLYFGKIFCNDNALKKSVELINQLPFDLELGVWNRLDPVRGILGIDVTYNHQSYVAAVASETNDKDCINKAERFLDVSLHGALKTTQDGLFCHKLQHIQKKQSKKQIGIRIREALKKWTISDKKSHECKPKKTHHADLEERDIGYHLYDLYSLARLRLMRPKHNLWKTDIIRQAMQYAVSDVFFNSLDDNHYAYPYNAPGFEYPIITQAFGDISQNVEACMSKAWDIQCNKTRNEKTQQFDRGTYDPLTLSARVYELAISLYRDLKQEEK